MTAKPDTSRLWDSLTALQAQAQVAYPSDKAERDRHFGASVAELMSDAEMYAHGRLIGEQAMADRLAQQSRPAESNPQRTERAA